MLPQSFDTKIVQKLSVLKMPQQTLISGDRGREKKEDGKTENTGVLLGKKVKICIGFV